MTGAESRRGLVRRLTGPSFLLLGVYQIALGIYFAAVRPSLLPEDVRFIGQPLPPSLEPWLDLVFTVMGGQMAALGVTVVALAVRSFGATVRSGLEVIALALAGLASAGVMSWVNFALDSDFKWTLLIPVILWVLAIGLASVAASRRPLFQ